MRETRTKLSPPELAGRWGISVDKVLAWIRRGELRAINIALSATGRPRWRIDLQDVREFEHRRAATPPAPARQRRRAQEVVEYF
jgi:excisionase family DNA binding protein